MDQDLQKFDIKAGSDIYNTIKNKLHGCTFSIKVAKCVGRIENIYTQYSGIVSFGGHRTKPAMKPAQEFTGVQTHAKRRKPDSNSSATVEEIFRLTAHRVSRTI